MSDWPETNLPTLVVSPFTRECGKNTGSQSIFSPASAVWPAANLAIYVPFSLARPTMFVKLFCVNGATTNGNVDMGIYDWAGTRIVSIGSTAQSGTTAVQAFDITDTLIGPGRFYLALACSSGTATFYRMTVGGTGVSYGREMGALEEASALPLPATATFAAVSTNNYIPMIAATTRSVV